MFRSLLILIFLSYFILIPFVAPRRTFCPTEALYSNPFHSTSPKSLADDASPYSFPLFYPSHSLTTEETFFSKFENIFENQFASMRSGKILPVDQYSKHDPSMTFPYSDPNSSSKFPEYLYSSPIPPSANIYSGFDPSLPSCPNSFSGRECTPLTTSYPRYTQTGNSFSQTSSDSFTSTSDPSSSSSLSDSSSTTSSSSKSGSQSSSSSNPSSSTTSSSSDSSSSCSNSKASSDSTCSTSSKTGTSTSYSSSSTDPCSSATSDFSHGCKENTPEYDGITRVRGSAKYEEDLQLSDSSSLDLFGNLGSRRCQTIIAYDTSSIVVKTKPSTASICPVYALSASKVSLFGHSSSFGKLFGCSEGWAYGRSTMLVFDWAEADVFDDARGFALNHASMRFYGRSKGIVRDHSTVELFDASRAFLFDKAKASVFIEPLMRITIAAFNNSEIFIKGCRGLENYYTKAEQESLASTLSTHQFNHGFLSKRRLSYHPVTVFMHDKSLIKVPVHCHQYISIVRIGSESSVSIEATTDISNTEMNEGLYNIASNNNVMEKDKRIMIEVGIEDGNSATIQDSSFSPTSPDASIQNAFIFPETETLSNGTRALSVNSLSSDGYPTQKGCNALVMVVMQMVGFVFAAVYI